MTLIVALVCQDGLVMASDSQATFPGAGGGTRQSIDTKIISAHDHFLIGASGHVGLIEKAHFEITKPTETASYYQKPLRELAKILTAKVNPVQRQVAEQYIPFPSPTNPSNMTPSGHFLFAGVRERAPWVIEIDPNGVDEFLHPFGLAAVGSGEQLAKALLQRHFEKDPPTVEAGKVFAWTAIDDAIAVAAYGLGPPICIWEIRPGKPPHQLEKGEIESLRDTANVWRQVVRDELHNLVGPRSKKDESTEAVEEGTPAEIPKPRRDKS